MKKIFLFLIVCLLFVGCSKSSKDNIIENVTNKLANMDNYRLSGTLSISSNDDTYNYDIVVSHKEKDDYRVSITNKSNNHEQIILKSNDEVYVITC